MTKTIPYGKQSITTEDEQAVLQALHSEFLTQGPAIAEFERKFADYIGTKFAVAVANGTAALHLCALALKVSKETRVITTPITFAASSNCVLYCGGEVHFADIDPETGCLDIHAVESLIASKPPGYFHGIIPVDFAGYPVNLEKFRSLAKKHNLWIIEDACHAPGAFFTDSSGMEIRCGSGLYADLAIFSFHPVKHIATGEGGMVTTNNESLYNQLLKLRTHGITKDPSLLQTNLGGWYYEMQTLGYNYRMPDLLCALGISQLKRADEGLLRRKAIASRYDEAFKATPGIRTFATDAALMSMGISHAYHLYIIRVTDRQGLYDYLRTRNIFTQVHYIPVYTMPYYRKNGFANTTLPNAEHYYAGCLSIPMYPTLSEQEQNFVIENILDYIKSHA